MQKTYLSRWQKISKGVAIAAMVFLVAQPLMSSVAYADDASTPVDTSAPDQQVQQGTDQSGTDANTPTDTGDVTTPDTDTSGTDTTAPDTSAPDTAQTPDVTAPAQTPAADAWVVNADGSYTTNSAVALGKTYTAPQNDQVTVTFTNLPATPGTLTIKEIKLSADEQAASGAVSDTAYDVTSSMDDGTFAYDLTLPMPANVDSSGVQVAYAETQADLDSTQTVSQDTTVDGDQVNVNGLDHFTIFFVVKPPILPCVIITLGHCYGTIQAAINAASNGDSIIVGPGTFSEQLTVTKNLTIEGAGKNQTFIQAPFSPVAVSGRDSILEVSNGKTLDLSKVTLEGTFNVADCSIGLYGAFVSGGAELDLHNTNVTEIRSTDPALRGCQNGVGLRAGSNALGTTGKLKTDNVTVDKYAKGGIVIDGTGSTGSIKNTTVTGEGQVNYVAQNGIQISRGAKGTVDGSTVTGNKYFNAGDPLYSYGSAGILGYDQGSGVVIKNSNLNNNDLGFAVFEDSAANNEVTFTNNSFGSNYRDIDFYDISGNKLDARSTTSWSGTGNDGIEAVINQNCVSSPFAHGACNGTSDYTDAGTGSVDYINLPACNGSTGTTFDSLNVGSVNGQDGWSATGFYDQSVVWNIYGVPTANFGCKSLRLSNGFADGAFGGQTFSPSNVNEAGESSSVSNGMSGGTRQNHFEAQFDLASVMPTLQEGLAVSVSPDRGDGARMSYLRFEDQSDGIHVFFDDVTDNGPLGTSANFNETDIATLSRDAAHTIKFSMDFMEGPHNDVVKIYIDGVLKETGTSWEDYYRFDPEQSGSGNQVPTTDSLIFAARGSSVPANLGNGFLFDNLSESSSTLNPTPITQAADPISNNDATLNGTNGQLNATGHSFWVSTSSFSTATPNIPANVYSSPDLGAINANTPWSYTLSSLESDAIVTGGAHSQLPTVQPNTHYYFVAWSLVNGTWYPGQELDFSTSAPNDVTVTIAKFVNGSHATADNTNNASFPMESTWNTTNIGSGTGDYALDANGFNNPNAYEATTSFMSSGADYSTHEIAANECTAEYPFKLDGYSTGSSLEAAETADRSAGTPSLTDITTNQYIIVWNRTCPPAPTHQTPADGTLTTTADQNLIDWTDVTDTAGPITYVYQAANTNDTNPDGSFVSPVYTSGVLTDSQIPTPGTPEGVYYWHVKAVDSAGNESSWTTPWKITVDNTPDTVTGIKFNDVNGNGVRDLGESPEPTLSNWTINAYGAPIHLDVNAQNSEGTSTDSLPAGQYLVKVSGTWHNRIDAGENELFDAEYYTQDNFATHTDGTTPGSYEGAGANEGDLVINNTDFVDWGTYNSDHSYTTTYNQVASGPINFSIFDGDATTGTKNESWYADNADESLSVDIYPVIASTVTGEDGSYTLTIPLGDTNVTVGEVQQEGWHQTAPEGSTCHFDFLNQDSQAVCDFGNQHDVITPEGPQFDLSITNVPSSTTPENGTTVTYTITVTNNGPDDATDVVVNDALPSGVTFQTTTASEGSYNDTTHIWTVGDLANGDSATLTITGLVTAGDGDNVSNTATITAPTDSDNSNNVGTATFDVSGTVNPGGGETPSGSGGGGGGGGTPPADPGTPGGTGGTGGTGTTNPPGQVLGDNTGTGGTTGTTTDNGNIGSGGASTTTGSTGGTGTGTGTGTGAPQGQVLGASTTNPQVAEGNDNGQVEGANTDNGNQNSNASTNTSHNSWWWWILLILILIALYLWYRSRNRNGNGPRP